MSIDASKPGKDASWPAQELRANTGDAEILLPSGKATAHLAVGATVGGAAVLSPNDLDVDWKKNVAYMSDSSTKWTIDSLALSVIEVDSTGRYDSS